MEEILAIINRVLNIDGTAVRAIDVIGTADSHRLRATLSAIVGYLEANKKKAE